MIRKIFLRKINQLYGIRNCVIFNGYNIHNGAHYINREKGNISSSKLKSPSLEINQIYSILANTMIIESLFCYCMLAYIATSTFDLIN